MRRLAFFCGANFFINNDEWILYSQSDLAHKKTVPVSEKLRHILVDLPEFARVCKNPESNEAKWLYLVAKAGDEEVLPDFGDPVFERAADRIRVNSASDELLCLKSISSFSIFCKNTFSVELLI